MKCPVCQSILVITHHDHYQDLGEHVSNPNATPSIKAGYQCTGSCICSTKNLSTVWIEDGSMFIKNAKISYYYDSEIVEKFSITGRTSAIGSWEDEYDEIRNLEKASELYWNFHWFKIKFTSKFYRNDITKKIYSNFFPKIEYLKKEGHLYVYIIPIFRMIKFVISEFLRKNKRIKEAIKENPVLKNYTINEIQECFRSIQGMDPFGRKGDRLYAKISSMIIRTFFYNKSKYIKDLINKYELHPTK